MLSLSDNNQSDVVEAFNSTSRYLDDLLNIDNPYFEQMVGQIYPTELHVQHFLSPYIDSEVNHKRHFIKIPFINKCIEFIDLHSIFKDNSVISSIPNYFNNSETPIICYKYNKPIRSTIFNFNKIVND